MELRRAVLLATLLCVASIASAAADQLRDGFIAPPESARPRVWWHWMNGNVTKEGIAKDLDWMQRVGLGGLQNFDANLTTPQIVDKRLVYMTPQWQEAFRYAVTLAQQKGLEFTIATSPGWSETGGPWVKAEDGMKKLVWSETSVEGGRRIRRKLVAPPGMTGLYQDLPFKGEATLFGGGEDKHEPPSHYGDVAVLAYRVAQPGVVQPRMRSGDGNDLDVAALTDHSLATFVEIASGTGASPAMIVIEYERPQSIQSVSLFTPGGEPTPLSPGLLPQLEVSDDARDWRKVTEIVVTSVPSTASFAAVTAKYFRVVFASKPAGARPRSISPPPGVDLAAIMQSARREPKQLKVSQLHLSSDAKISQFEAKAGFSVVPEYYALDTPLNADSKGIDPKDVVDLTKHMQPHGTLDWNAPSGYWRVLRLGWSLTGKMNHPATNEATGLEVDKLDGAAVRRYLEHYLGMYKAAVGADHVGAQGIRALVADSTEVGSFNWTPRMVEHFSRLRGYDPTPWLPTLTGAIIGSRRQSDAFLYDFRRTLAELHASEHYGTLAAVAHENQLKVYGEALEGGRPSLGDDMALRSHADYPMGAMWWFPRTMDTLLPFAADLKGASSVANVYGQNIAAAESLTSALMPWASAPSDLRRIIDLEFAYGINRPVIHTSVHQPLDDRQPGLSLQIFGQYFNRHETWAEMARPWIDYISRNSYLLQQGRNVADVAYFYGEEAPLTAQNAQQFFADVPTRYAYDFLNPDAALNVLRNDGGDLVTPSGARYRALYLGGASRKMTLQMLRRLTDLAAAGATIVGNAPESSPSLHDDAAEFSALVAKLWDGKATTTVGKGRVIPGSDIEAALASIGVRPDFTYSTPRNDTELRFVHRRLQEGDLYFVNNRRNRAESVEARFRVRGKVPEIWRADTGASMPVSYRIESDDTVVPLNLLAEDSFFVVFRTPATAASATVEQPVLTSIQQLNGPWEVNFQAGRGAPPSIRLERLASLSEHSDAGVKYFSGIATYQNQFSLPRSVRPGTRLMLDLGSIGDIAEVRVNDQLVGTAWHAPYQVDIGAAVKRGINEIEIRVANVWVNRLIGDKQAGATKITWTAAPTYTANAPLRPAGLIGPVQLLVQGK